MTVEGFVRESGFKPICIPNPQKKIDGAYVGDLLSWVMGNASGANVWITIMSNINTVAVATLVDVSCIVLAEDVMPDDDMLKVAKDKGVNILSTPLSAYAAAIKTSELIN